MKSRTTIIALSISLVLILVSVAPAPAALDEARIKSLIKNYMALVARGDFSSAMKLKIKKLSVPPKGSFKYRMVTRLAGAFMGVDRVEIKGDRAKAYFKLDPKVVEYVVKQVYQHELDRARKITDPQKRAAAIKRLEKYKDRMIAYRVKSMSRSTVILQKQGNKWLII